MASAHARGGARRGGASGPDLGSWRSAPVPASREPAVSLPTTLPQLRRERLLFVYAALVGEIVDVQVRSGAVYRGVFSASNVSSKNKADPGVVLKMVRLVRGPKGVQVVADLHSKFIRILVVQSADLVQVSAKNVSLEGDCRSETSPAVAAEGRFATDSEISGGNAHSVRRQLTKFEDFSSQPTAADDPTILGILGADPDSKGKWDQFEVNERKFGVQTSYDEHEYTTRLDRSDPNFGQKARKAERLASEIERKTSRNAHVMEDRGANLHPDVDEEAMYGSVTRDAQFAQTDQSFTSSLRGTTPPHSTPADCDPQTPGSVISAGAGQPERVHRTSSSSPSDTRFAGRPPSRNPSVESMPALATEAASRLRALAAASAESRSSHDNLQRIDHLKASKQVRKSLSGAASPGSGSRSPLNSSLVGDPVGMASLNLDRSTPKITKEVSTMFEEFKATKASEQSAETLRKLKASTGSSHLVRSPSITMKDSQLQRRGSASETKPPADARGSSSTESGHESSTPVTRKKLNPNARPFSFNPGAAEFRPASSFTPSSQSQRLSSGSVSQTVQVSPVVGSSYIQGGVPPGMDSRSGMIPQQFLDPRYMLQQPDARVYQSMGYPVQQMTMGMPQQNMHYYPYQGRQQGYSPQGHSQGASASLGGRSRGGTTWQGPRDESPHVPQNRPSVTRKEQLPEESVERESRG